MEDHLRAGRAIAGGSAAALRRGVRRPEGISPDNWLIDRALLERSGNKEIQLQLFYDYGSNPPLYPKWQQYLRRYQPPTLIVWGKNNQIFPAEGAYPYKRDLKNLEFHLLDTGHFALEEDGDTIARLMREFLEQRLSNAKSRTGHRTVPMTNPIDRSTGLYAVP